MKELRGVALLEEECHWGLEVSKAHARPSVSLSVVLNYSSSNMLAMSAAMLPTRMAME